MGTDPQLQDSMSAFAPVTALYFADRNPFAFLFFCKIHLDAAL